MRKLIAMLAVPMVAACSLTLAPLAGAGQNCRDGSNQRGSQCDTQIPIVIIIGPSYQYSDNSDTMCYQFSPGSASVPIGGSYSFQNNTSSSITILGADRTPWVTVAPGSTSSTVSFPNAGTHSYGVQGCRGVGGTPWYGALAVTAS